MKSLLLVEKDSAMENRQKFCINSNELTRRLYNVDEENVGEKEISSIIEHYTKQLKNSGWSRRDVREKVVCGYIGWRRILLRREEY